VPFRRAVILLAAATLVVAAGASCGGNGDDEEGDPRPAAADAVLGGADPEAVEVIRDWVDTLRRGDVEGAAGYFEVPSIAENGPTLIRIESQADAVRFNASLPCGAVLVGAQSEGEFTTATFRLTERPGPGTCGPGTGGMAQTAFVIAEGKIVEWRRIDDGPQPPPGRAT
jgi:hypothetical protein